MINIIKMIKNNLWKIAIAITFLVITIVTGNPIVKNDMWINLVIGIIGCMFILRNLVLKKENLITRNNIIVFCLCCSTCIPLIFNTFVSLNGTLYYIFRYISVFVMYVLTIMFIKEDERNKDFLIKIIIAAGGVLVLFGIDLQTTNISTNFITTIIGLAKDQEFLTRMYSLFLYSNTFAISIAVSYFLLIGLMLKEDSKIYNIGISTVLFSGILLSQSRITLFLTALGLLAYIIFIKGKEERNMLIKILVINTVFSFIVTIIYSLVLRTGIGILAWISLVIASVLSIVVFKYTKDNKKIDKLINIRTFIIFILIITLAFVIALFFKSDLILFNGKNSQIQMTKEIFGIKANTDYNFKLNIEAIAGELKDNYTISFNQINKYTDNIKEDKKKIDNYAGDIEFNIHTNEGVESIIFSITANKVEDNTKLIVKNLSINDKEFVLNYKFLPTDMINQIKNITLNQRSVWERGTLIVDGLKIVKQNPLFGIGGDGWRDKSKEVQSYHYDVAEMHSYPIQVWVEFGILGIIAFLSIMIITSENIFKNLKQRESEGIAISIAFIVLFLHTLVDFDMTFLYVLIVYFVLIAMINTENYENKEPRKSWNLILSLIIIFAISISFIYNAIEAYTKVTRNEALINAKTNEEKVSLQQSYINLIPYNENYKKDRIDHIDAYLILNRQILSEEEKETIKREKLQLLKECLKIEREKQDNVNKYIEILELTTDEADIKNAYEMIGKEFRKHRYDANKIVNDYLCLSQYKDDENLQRIINEYLETDIKNISNYEKCRITKEKSIELIKMIQGGYQWNFLY